MKYIVTESQYRLLSEKAPKTIIGFHGSKFIIDEFHFPLFITTSKLRGMTFAVSMKWDENEKKNVFTSLKGGEEGYLYTLEITNPKFQKWSGGPSDEKILEGGEITILKIEKIGTEKILNNYLPNVVKEQNENRIIKMIKDFVNDYKEGRLVRTECDVDYDPKNKVYIITPTFYVEKKENFPYMIFKHSLSDRIDDYLGITTHILKPIVKEI